MKIAIVGATGIVGRTVLQILEEKNLSGHEYLLYASEKSAGKKIKFFKKFIQIKKLSDGILSEKVDIALFCTKENISKNYIEKLAKNNATVIDFSSFYRKKKPLIVPEINPQDIKGKTLCNPNCSTIGAVVALYEIEKKFGLERIVFSTYQAVSGAGKNALDDLNAKEGETLKSFAFPIKNNIIPYIGEIDKDGYSKEEKKMIFETKKILHRPDLKVTATCVRVPVEVGHGESVNFQTKRKCSQSQIEAILRKTKGVRVENDFPKFPMPIYAKGGNDVIVGRIRKDFSQENSFNIFIVSDNLRRGAAQNAVEILEELLRRKNDCV